MRSLLQDLTILRDRRFRLFFAGRTIAVLGSSFAPVALAFGVLGLPGATASTLSVVLAAESIPMILFMLVGGVLADRFPRDRVIMAGNLLCAIGFSGTALMLISGWAPVWALATAGAIGGTGVAVFFPALVGIVPQVVAAEQLQTGNSLLRFGTNAARVAGAAAAGAVVALLGGGWALTVSAGLFITSGLLIAALRLPRTSSEAGPNMLHELKVGWREFASRQWLWVVVLQFSVMVAGFHAGFGVLGPVVAKAELGGAPAWSAILAAEAIGMIVGVFVALRIRPRRPILVAVLMCLPSALPFALLGISAPLWTVIASAVLMGIAFDVFGVLWETTMQREIPGDTLSRVSAYDALGSLMFGPVGLLLAGPAVGLIGVHEALLVCAFLVVAASLAALLSPGVRNLRAPDPGSSGEPVTSSPAPVGASA